jgi:hypothetical protein
MSRPTPAAPSALPLKGATPAARQCRFRGVHVIGSFPGVDVR